MFQSNVGCCTWRRFVVGKFDVFLSFHLPHLHRKNCGEEVYTLIRICKELHYENTVVFLQTYSCSFSSCNACNNDVYKVRYDDSSGVFTTSFRHVNANRGPACIAISLTIFSTDMEGSDPSMGRHLCLVLCLSVYSCNNNDHSSSEYTMPSKNKEQAFVVTRMPNYVSSKAALYNIKRNRMQDAGSTLGEGEEESFTDVLHEDTGTMNTRELKTW